MKSVGRVLPLYVVVFIGFVGYSLMITVFTPLLLGDGGGLAAISTALPLPVMGGLALLGSALIARPAAREAAEPFDGRAVSSQ